MPRAVYGYDANGNQIVRSSSATEDTNIPTLIAHANTALGNNATFLALGSPTNAQLVAQAQALTRQCNGLIRFLLGQFDTITDS